MSTKKKILLYCDELLVKLLNEKSLQEEISRNEYINTILWNQFSEDEVENARLTGFEDKEAGRPRIPKRRSYTNPYNYDVSFKHPIKGMIPLAPGETVEWVEV